MTGAYHLISNTNQSGVVFPNTAMNNGIANSYTLVSNPSVPNVYALSTYQNLSYGRFVNTNVSETNIRVDQQQQQNDSNATTNNHTNQTGSGLTNTVMNNELVNSYVGALPAYQNISYENFADPCVNGINIRVDQQQQNDLNVNATNDQFSLQHESNRH